MARPLELPQWPNGSDVAVSLTFDVDAESAWLGADPDYERRLTTLSEGRFSVVRGVPRILEVLRKASIRATFYIPGDTAERHRHGLDGLLENGHEIGHHGHLHLRSDIIDAAAQRDEVERGLNALDRNFGIRPRGYRSAAWQLTPETFELIKEFGFEYDSSCMGDDRPYLEEHGDMSILELPVHWSLDDWPHFGWTTIRGGVMQHPDAVVGMWLQEFESALVDRRHVTYTMHPEVIGRGYRIQVLERLIDEIQARANVWFATHDEVATLVARAQVATPGP